VLGSPEAGAAAALSAEVERVLAEVSDARLVRAADVVRAAIARALRFLATASPGSFEAVEAGARGVALTLGRGLALALALRHADWSLREERDGRAAAAALRFLRNGIEAPLGARPGEDARALAGDLPLPAEHEIVEEPPHTMRGEVWEGS